MLCPEKRNLKFTRRVFFKLGILNNLIIQQAVNVGGTHVIETPKHFEELIATLQI